MNTILAAVGSTVTISLIGVFGDAIGSKQNITLKFDVVTLTSTVMAGCVSVTACCNNVEPSSSLLVGLVGAAIYKATVALFLRLEIDDPL